MLLFVLFEKNASALPMPVESPARVVSVKASCILFINRMSGFLLPLLHKRMSIVKIFACVSILRCKIKLKRQTLNGTRF